MKNNFSDLVETFAILRGPNGCPWDIKQTHESLIKNLREESEELIAATHKLPKRRGFFLLTTSSRHSTTNYTTAIRTYLGM